jgi:septum formation protein
LGKPYDYDDAYNTLNSLSDQTHQVFTGVCLILVETGIFRETSFFERTDVTFYPVSHQEIVEYLATDEPFDKAGSYGIQGRGGLFVRGISGDYNNVVGLPIARLYHEINNLMQGLRD